MNNSVQISAVEFAALRAELDSVTSNVAALNEFNLEYARNMDNFFLCTMGTLVFCKQLKRPYVVCYKVVVMASAGFACLEAGSVRRASAANLLMMNTMTFSKLSEHFVPRILMTAVAFWIIGFTFAFGPAGNTIFGWGWMASGNTSDNFASLWFFQFTCAASSASVPSGAVAERMGLVANIIFALVFAAFIYPWSTHWTCGGGWLKRGDGYIGYQDFAGSGSVNIVGGTAAMVGAVILGPRVGRFTRINGGKQANPFGSHSPPLVALGFIIVLFGFLGFNGGSRLHISQPGDGAIVAIAFANTCIACAFGFFSSMMLKNIGTGKWSLLTSVNGGLAGLVSISAGANLSHQWGACCTGALAGAVYYVTSITVARLHVDDPVDAISVNLAGGFWGAIAQPIFKRDGILTSWSRIAFKGLAWNLLGAVVLTAWSALTSSIVFLALRSFGLLRVEIALETGQDDDAYG